MEELLARYELEPSLRDVYTEGPSDRQRVQHFLRAHKVGDVGVYEVDTVDVPYEFDPGGGQESGQRQRLIALGVQLQERCRVGLQRRVACIVDADSDYLFGYTEESPLVLRTDYCALELYAFDEGLLAKFVDLVLLGLPFEARDVLNGMTETLQQLFYFRAANRRLRLGLSWLSPERCCSLDGSVVRLDEEDFLRRYLNKSAKLDRLEEFRRACEEVRAAGRDLERRRCIHGHDFVELLRWYVEQVKNTRYAPVLFERSLWACVDVKGLGGERLFATLLERFLGRGQ